MDFVVLDLETTGLDCQRDEIIEIGGVRISHGILCEEFATLIQPKRSIPEKITWLTGIDDEMVRGMPEFSQVLPQLESFLAGAVLVGHNIAKIPRTKFATVNNEGTIEKLIPNTFQSPRVHLLPYSLFPLRSHTSKADKFLYKNQI